MNLSETLNAYIIILSIGLILLNLSSYSYGNFLDENDEKQINENDYKVIEREDLNEISGTPEDQRCFFLFRPFFRRRRRRRTTTAATTTTAAPGR